MSFNVFKYQTKNFKLTYNVSVQKLFAKPFRNIIRIRLYNSYQK